MAGKEERQKKDMHMTVENHHISVSVGISKAQWFELVCQCNDNKVGGTPNYTIVYDLHRRPGGFKVDFPEDDVNNFEDVVADMSDYGLDDKCKKCLLETYKRKPRSR
jgi:hypothetical protein